MKNLELYTITEDIVNQATIAEVIKLLLLNHLSFSDCLIGEQLEIKEFNNCRESGYVYRVINSKQDITFSVYEHRNSDDIIINGCFTKDLKTYGAYNGDSKWDYLNNFSYDQHYAVARQLGEYLRQSYLGLFNESILKGGK